MGCPRCGGEFTTYTLDGRRTVICEGCGYVGVPVDHHAKGTRAESWGEALRRFRERRREGRERVVLFVGGDTYLVRSDLYDRYTDLTEKQQAIVWELLAEPTPTDPERTHADIGAAAGAHGSYVSEIIDEYGALVAALAESEIVASG